MPTFYNPLEVMRLRNDAGIRFSIVGATFGPDVRRNADGTPKKHQGWDLYAPQGTPAYAVADGIVVWTRNHGDYGMQLLLQFNREGSLTSSPDSTLYAFYAHLSKIKVSVMDQVRGGRQIALTGTTGNADPRYPHLHFEIRTTASTGVTGLNGRLDPSTILGGQILSCTSELIGGIDTVRMVCSATDQATPVSP
jgi:murein DD-endopeptidase MepM/ murein hydrolase activator NlpD